MTDTGRTAPEDHGVVMDVTHARQARRGKHVLWILIISLVLVVAALFGAWGMRAQQLQDVEPHNGRQPADAQAFQAPEPAARQTR